MELTTEDVLKVAQLARLDISDADLGGLTKQLARIVHLVEQLGEVATEGIEPLAHALDVHSVLRDDERVPGLTRLSALENAPDSDEECFRVPAVMGPGN